MSTVDTLLKAMRKASKVNDGSLKDEQLQNAVANAILAVEKRIDYHTAVALRVDNWLPACNGAETEFKTRTGLRVLYCWNPALDRHAYINLDTDTALTDEEASEALSAYYQK